MDKVGVGIIGAGNISGAYLKAIRWFEHVELKGIADINPAASEARSAEFDVPAMDVETLLGRSDIEIVINLTVPKVHLSVGKQILDAGKHVYAEKPLGISFAEGRELMDHAAAKGLRVGSAPDTFLGAGHQRCRQLIDDGAIGPVVGGTAFFMCPGHEMWHPAPAFYYEVGGGPVLDMGPYYITALVNMLGPVSEVVSFTARPQTSREIFSEPKRGEKMPVDIDTHVGGLLRFANGSIVQVILSFDVRAHRHSWIELYGQKSSLAVPDPNFFGGKVEMAEKRDDWREIENLLAYGDENYRSLGVADMAHAIRTDRPHRASGDLALHVLEVMEALTRSGPEKTILSLTTSCERPAPLHESLDGKRFK